MSVVAVLSQANSLNCLRRQYSLSQQKCCISYIYMADQSKTVPESLSLFFVYFYQQHFPLTVAPDHMSPTC